MEETGKVFVTCLNNAICDVIASMKVSQNLIVMLT